MAELDTEARDRLRSSQFAYVDSAGEEHLPINDASHRPERDGSVQPDRVRERGGEGAGSTQDPERGQEVRHRGEPGRQHREADHVAPSGKHEEGATRRPEEGLTAHVPIAVKASRHRFAATSRGRPSRPSRLGAARSIWLATARPDGRAMVAPVWYWWDGDATPPRLYFITARRTQKARNLRHRDWAEAHLGDGDDVVIVRGHVEIVADPVECSRVDAEYRRRYVDPHSGAQASVFDNPDDDLYRLAADASSRGPMARGHVDGVALRSRPSNDVDSRGHGRHSRKRSPVPRRRAMGARRDDDQARRSPCEPVLGGLRWRRDRVRVILRRQASRPASTRPARHPLLPGKGVRREGACSPTWSSRAGQGWPTAVRWR